jgi:parallel beta-helix repeat protein
MFVFAFNIQPARAQGTITINADGSISPSTAPISTVDNITYTLTGNISGSIVVQRNNIVVDGAGYTVEGTEAAGSIGIDLSGRNNVTIKNMNIETFSFGFLLDYSFNDTISGNKITNNGGANNNLGIVYIYASRNCTISRNNILNNLYYSIALYYSSNCTVKGNNITANFGGVDLEYEDLDNVVSGNNITANRNFGVTLSHDSRYNTVSGNNIAHNEWGAVTFYSGGYDRFFHNNFINNTQQVQSDGSPNTWDDGYPSGGNYWSDYTGVDEKSGPYQNLTGSDGIGDTPYVIDSNNIDHYPLMKPYVPFENQTIYIRADGSIDPSGAPILRKGNLYTLIGNINSNADGIVIEKDNIVIDGKGYTVQGEQSGSGLYLADIDYVTIKNANIEDFGYGIYLSSCSHNSISGNNITANWPCGIWLDSSSNNTINGNSIEANADGIDLGSSSNNNISRNNIRANGDDIWLDYSSNNTINGNDVAESYYGIIFDLSCSSNNVSENSITKNTFGICVGGVSNYNILSGNNITDNHNCGLELEDSYHCTVSGNVFQDDGLFDFDSFHNVVESNFVNGKPLYYLEGVSGKIVSSDAGQVVLVNCSSIVVNNLTLSNTTEGVDLYLTSNTVIADNNITNNHYGILFDYSNYNTISRNNITADSIGIYLDLFSSNNSISGNNITANSDHGIFLEFSSYNRFFHNNFVNNAQQVLSDGSPNTWDNGYPSGGNYWSDYQKRYPNAAELDSSSIWNTPYIMMRPWYAIYIDDPNNTDRYPLMKPFSAPLTPTYTLTITTSIGGTTNPAPGAYSYTANSSVQATAIPEQGYSFDHWELDSVSVGSANPYTVFMNKNHTLEAVFSSVKPSVPVGGYSIPIQGQFTAGPSTQYLILTLALTIGFTAIKRKTKRKTR